MPQSFDAVGWVQNISSNADTGNDIYGGPSNTPAGLPVILPIPPDVGENMSLVSDNAADNAIGTGAQLVEVNYLDSSGNPQLEVVTMNGLTNVRMKANNVRFVQDIHVIRAGSNNLAQGDITIFSTSTPANIYSKIGDQTNMSLNSARMVPSGKILYIMGWSASGTLGTANTTAPGGNINVRLRVTMHPGTSTLSPRLFHFIDSFTLFNSVGVKKFETPLEVPSFAIIKATAFCSIIGTNIDAQSTWEGYIMPS